MPTATFGTTTKRINSTARPTLAASFSISFKQPCSMERPVLLLASDDGILAYNYFSLYSRYYWITDCVSIRAGLWEIHGEVDALATLRPAILGTSAYIERAGSGYNTWLPDTTLPIPNKASISTTQTQYFDAIDPYYILTAAGNNGGLTTYALKEAQFQQLLQAIQTYQTTAMPDITAGASVMDALRDLGNQLAKAFRQLFSFGSCLEAIAGCIWIPYAPGLLGASQTIYLGDYDTGVQGNLVEYSAMRSRDTTLTFPLAGDWRDYAPYTRFSLYIPFYGVVTLPNADVIDSGGSIIVNTSMSPTSGSIAFAVRSNTGRGKVILTGSGNIGAQVKIARNNVDILGAAGGAVRVALGDYSAIPALAMSCLDRDVDSAGTLSTVAAMGLSTQMMAQTETRYPAAYPGQIPVIGHPVGAVGTLSDFAGAYVQTRDAHISGSSEDRSITERAEGALNGGVYLE